MTDRVPRSGLDAQGIATAAEIFWNLTTAPLVEHAVRRGEGLLAKDGPLVVRTGKHTGRSAKDKFIVGRSPRTSSGGTTATSRWSPRRSTGCTTISCWRWPTRTSSTSPTSLADRSPSIACSVRVINELAWHNLFIRTLLVRPEADELADFAPEYHDHRPAELPRRSGASRLPQRDGDRGQLLEEDDPDRRHRLCRRDEEVGVRPSELPAAAAGHHADALLGQHRARRRHRDLLRPLRHRQDDAFGRPEPHADRRRRAWLVGHRGLQFRRRLLRQDDPPVGRSPSRRSTRPPSASARCSRTS